MNTNEQAAPTHKDSLSVQAIEQQRAAFEARFPMPKNCQWGGNGYAPTEYDAWDAQAYVNKWEGWKARAEFDRQGRGEPVGMTSIADMCRILKEHYVEEAERTDCTILYTVTFDQLRAIYDRGRREGPQPADPVVKESLTVAEPVKEVSDDDLEELMGRFVGYSGCIHDDAFVDCARALLAKYGQPAQPAASAEPVAVVGSVFQLLWAGNGDFPALIKRHELKPGSKLYAAPVAAQPSVPDTFERARTIVETWPGWKRDYVLVKPAAPDGQAQRDAEVVDARIDIGAMERFRKWNRSQENPPVRIASEYGVYQAAIAADRAKRIAGPVLTPETIATLAATHLHAFAQNIGAGEVWYEGEQEFARAVEAAVRDKIEAPQGR